MQRSIWPAAAQSVGRLALVAIFSCTPASRLPGAQPVEPPAPIPTTREAPAASGLARRPNPKLADRTSSGTALRPFANHRKMGAVYHTVAVKSFNLSAPLPGLQSNPSDLVGYVVARIPMNAASNGALGPVIVAGQWQIPWPSLVDPATLARWSTAEGGPLKLDEYPAVALTIRNAVDTRLLSRDEAASTYMCSIVADITVNGITTERVIQRAIISFNRGAAADQTIKGEQLSIRAKWQVRLSDFFSSLPGVASLPTIDAEADLLMSTVSPDGQKDLIDNAPAPQDAPPASAEPDSPGSSNPADVPPKERK